MMKALDLFCGAGGVSMGLHRAGYEVTGVDIAPQPRYPFTFYQTDALTFPLEGYDLIWASPPCQGYGQSRHIVSCVGREYPMLIDAARARLMTSEADWIIENVPGAPMQHPVMICGTALGLRVRRHRLFDSSLLLFAPGPCRHRPGDLGVYGGKVKQVGTRGVAYLAGTGRTHYRPLETSKQEGCEAMGIDWMTLPEMCEAIPPAYAEWLGRQVMSSRQRASTGCA